MRQLLGLFNHYDITHPLWAGERYLAEQCELFCVSFDRYDQEIKLSEMDPDAILTDSFFPSEDIISKCHVVYYVTDRTFGELISCDAARRSECLGRLKKACSVVAITSEIAASLSQDYGIEASIQLPCVIDQPKSQPQYVYYDPNFKWGNKLQAALPREEFRPLANPNDLGKAKAYIAVPPSGCFYHLTLAVASHRVVPTIVCGGKVLSDFTKPCLKLPEGSGFEECLPSVRSLLRDRSHFLEKLKNEEGRYRDMKEINRKVRDALNARPAKRLTEAVKAQPVKDSKQLLNQRRRRTPVVHPTYQTPHYAIRDTIFLTGGIGDVFAIESFFSDEQRVALTTILYATHKYDAIKELFERLPNYPELCRHEPVWTDFRNFWCFLYKDEVVRRLGDKCPQDLRDAEDWGIVPKFPIINTGMLKYNGSSFVKYQLADVRSFHLPMNYVVVQPYSTDKRMGSRDFNDADWLAATYWLKKNKIKGVVINKGGGKVPQDDCYIDLSNKTTVSEAVEITKEGKGYLGVDSWLSVLAPKLFEDHMIGIKSINSHCYTHKHIYFAPKVKFDFLSRELHKALKF